MTKKNIIGFSIVLLLAIVLFFTIGYYCNKAQNKEIDKMYAEIVEVDTMHYASNYKSDHSETGLLFNTQESEELSDAISQTISNTINGKEITQTTIDNLNQNLEIVIAEKIHSMGKNVTKEELEFLTSGLQAIAISNIYKIIKENPETSFVMSEIAKIYNNVSNPQFNLTESENITLVELQKKIEQQQTLYDSKTYQLNNTVEQYSSLIQQILENESDNIEQLVSMQDQINSIQSTIDLLEKNVTNNNGTNNNESLSEKEKTELKNELLELESIIQIIQSNYSSNSTDNGNILSEIETIKTTIKTITADLDGMGSLNSNDISSLALSLSGLKTLVNTNYKEHQSDVSTINAELTDTKSQLQSEMDTTKSQLQSELTTTKTDLQTEMNTTKNQLQSEVSTTKNQLQSEMDTTKSQLQSEMDSNVEQINQNIDELNDNVNNMVKYKNDNGKPTLVFSLPSQ